MSLHPEKILISPPEAAPQIPDGLPEKLYVVSGQFDAAARALADYGYEVEAVVDTTAKLFLLTAPEEH